MIASKKLCNPSSFFYELLNMKVNLPDMPPGHAPSDAAFFLKSGLGVSVYGTALAATTGVVCPACVMVAPALIGAGVYKTLKNKRNQA